MTTALLLFKKHGVIGTLNAHRRYFLVVVVVVILRRDQKRQTILRRVVCFQMDCKIINGTNIDLHGLGFTVDA